MLAISVFLKRRLMMKTEMVINPIDPRYHQHNAPKGFREQLAVLYFGSITEDKVHLIRSYLRVGLSTATSFDPERPGADSAASWQLIDRMIEEEQVCGVFHTHPPGIHDFSGQDWASMRAFAVANGKRYLFYGVQALDHEMSHFVCLNMLGGRVFVYDYGWHPDDLGAKVITLPLPPKFKFENDVYMVEM
jgi:hypothetical protein